MTTGSGPGPGGRELQELLQFFYQCPVGLIEIEDGGAVRRINPAAVRMLAPALAGEDLQQIFTLLARLCPTVVETITTRPRTVGPLAAAVRVRVSDRAGREDWLELSVVRVERDRVMITMVDVSEERRLAAREHELAVRLQRSMLGRIDTAPGVDVSVTYRPAEIDHLVGGDWYDLIELSAGRVGLAVGDVVGHSVEAAITMGQLRNAVRAMAPWCTDPGELLQRADQIAGRIDGGSFVTMAYATFDASAGDLVYACAGHPPPLLVQADGSSEYLMGGRGFPLGCGLPALGETASARLEVGDRVLLYSDGLIERRGEDLTVGLERLQQVAAGVEDWSAPDTGERLASGMPLERPLRDDLCVLTMHYANATATIPTPAGSSGPTGRRAIARPVTGTPTNGESLIDRREPRLPRLTA